MLYTPTLLCLILLGLCCVHGVKLWDDKRRICHCKNDTACREKDGWCSHGCESGWFGPGCQNRMRFWSGGKYLCHCMNGKACYEGTGFCPNGCDPEWFGPACQYKSVAYHTKSSKQHFIADNDDNQCLNGTEESVTLILDTPQALTWIRVVSDGLVHLTTFMIRKQAVLKIDTQKSNDIAYSFAKVDRRTVDIKFSKSIYSYTPYITLIGPVASTLCSVYISGGRNVALKQQTKQSSTQSTTLNTPWYASHGVDGDPAPIITDAQTYDIERFCSHTSNNYIGWWQVKFSKPSNIVSFRIYNRREPYRGDTCCQSRLNGFSLIASSASNRKIFKYKEPGSPKNTKDNKDVYTVVPKTVLDGLVKKVLVLKNKYSKYLTICELQAFGETPCPHGRFGLACEKKCNCGNGIDCFIHSGGCPA